MAMRDSRPKRLDVLYNRGCSGSSRKAAIRSMCLECCGYVSKEVANCTDKGCPLYLYREKG